MKENMRLSICTPVFNNWNFTKAYLKDLSKLPNDCEVIVVNNGSTDKTVEEFSKATKHNNYVLINNPDNKGFAKASNQAYEIAKGEYILFLNNDIRVQSDFENWVDRLIESAGDGLSGPTMGYLNSDLNFVKESDKEENYPYKYLSGWCLCGKKTTFDKFIVSENEFRGVFIEDMKSYFEDSWLGIKAKEMNIPLTLVKVPVTHFGMTTSRKMNISEMYRSAREIFLKKMGR